MPDFRGSAVFEIFKVIRVICPDPMRNYFLYWGGGGGGGSLKNVHFQIEKKIEIGWYYFIAL